jgi:hypothetical protein
MPDLSTSRGPRLRRTQLLVIIGFFASLACLLAYLYTACLPAGDGAAYLDQVLAGQLAERTLHFGYLIQLWAFARVFGDAGAPLLSAVWAMVAAVAAWRGAAVLLRGRGPWWLPLVAPALLLGMAPFWRHALFAEVYGPSGAALLSAAALRVGDRAVASAVLAGVAVTMHPGSLAWVPALALMGSRPWRYLGGSLVLPALVAAAFHGDYLLGDRGVLAELSWPRPWLAAQRTWRLLAAAAPLSGALVLLSALDPVARRTVVAPGLAGLGIAILTDWRDDVPAALPALYLAVLVAPSGVRLLLDGLAGQRAWVGAGVVALLVFGMGDATSSQDRARRIVERDVATIRALGELPASPRPWGTYGERVRYGHYVPTPEGSTHVMLPPGRAFPTASCEEQREQVQVDGRVFVCDRRPVDP